MDASAISDSARQLERAIGSLEASVDSLHGWLEFCIFLVAAGVIVEVFVVVAEYRHGLADFRRGTISSPAKPSGFLFFLGILGSGMVAVGVAGEFGIDNWSGRLETQLRSKNHELTALFQKAASEAIERAAANEKEASVARREASVANERSKLYQASIAEANARAVAAQAVVASANAASKDAVARVASAEARSAEASAKAESFRVDIAKANESVARETARAAESNLALARLQEKLRGWNLNTSQIEAIRLKLRRFAGVKYALEVDMASTEFMQTIDALLISAGWSRQTPDNPILVDNKAAIRQGTQNIVALSRTMEKTDLGVAASALVRALRAEDVEVEYQAIDPPSDKTPNTVRVIIGRR